MPRAAAVAVPQWVIDGWYSNNAEKQRLAIIHFHHPVTTAAERAKAKAYKPDGISYACASCGKFAFNRPRICFWCNLDLTR